MNPALFKALYEGFFDRMTNAGWIDRYAFEPGKGISVQWTEDGTQHAGLLKHMVALHALRSGPHQARLFDISSEECLAGRPPRMEITNDEAQFWKHCMAQLELHRDDLDFTSMVHVIEDYAPDIELSPAEE